MRLKYPCDCCGYKTKNEEKRGSYEICPVCFWEDAGYIDEEGYYNTGEKIQLCLRCDSKLDKLD